MPDLSHLWQRFLLASALVFGLLIGVAATVFGYSNLGTVDLRWSILHLDGVPLWTVAIVPLAVFLVAGTLYHWFNSLHHFTEHMRHRHRVHELEAEVTRLKAHLDHLLEMPDGAKSTAPALEAPEPAPPALVPALPEPAAANGESKTIRRGAQRKKVMVDSDTIAQPSDPAAVDGDPETAETGQLQTAAPTPAEV